MQTVQCNTVTSEPVLTAVLQYRIQYNVSKSIILLNELLCSTMKPFFILLRETAIKVFFSGPLRGVGLGP